MPTLYFTGLVQYFTAGAGGLYDIIAYGAQGGAGTGGSAGGQGVEIGGDLYLTAGEKLEIVVGGQGHAYGGTRGGGGGGGGGSFVFDAATDTKEVIAGGGGGGGRFAAGLYGSLGNAGGRGGYGINGIAGGLGGVAGGGGSAGLGGGAGGGGGGFSGAGGGGGGGGIGGHGGLGLSGGFVGGAGGIGAGYGGAGGFGGGGGGGEGRGYGGGGGGGGGGYSGGGSGANPGGGRGGEGGGGGSFLAASATDAFERHSATMNGLVKIEAVCFLAGTRVLTPSSETAIEALAIGDLVTTSDGRHAPVRWIGRQTISRTFADPLRVLPIRVKAGALADNAPSRDLLLSPCHAVLVGDILVQAGALLNGVSIVRETNMPETFVYYHVELNDHALILAEGVGAETFIDNAERMAFDNWHEHLALYPDGHALEEMPLPRAQSHRQVPAAMRHTLSARAAAMTESTALAA